jgi:hypothetical protein
MSLRLAGLASAAVPAYPPSLLWSRFCQARRSDPHVGRFGNTCRVAHAAGLGSCAWLPHLCTCAPSGGEPHPVAEEWAAWGAGSWLGLGPGVHWRAGGCQGGRGASRPPALRVHSRQSGSTADGVRPTTWGRWGTGPNAPLSRAAAHRAHPAGSSVRQTRVPNAPAPLLC